MQLHIFKDTEALSVAAAEWITDLIQEKLKRQPRFALLLSGGNTPKELYTVLATDKYRNRIDWSHLYIFFGDERVVPFDDERNNGKMAYESLLKHVSIPKEQVYFIDTNKNPARAAEEYDKLLHQYFDNQLNTFDLALLGIGEDGHTLSLFPGSALIHEKNKWATSQYLPSQQMHRITLTHVIVNRSAHTSFLVTGKTKAIALKKVLYGNFEPEIYPAQLIQPNNKKLDWFIDEAAASAL